MLASRVSYWAVLMFVTVDCLFDGFGEKTKAPPVPQRILLDVHWFGLATCWHPFWIHFGNMVEPCGYPVGGTLVNQLSICKRLLPQSPPPEAPQLNFNTFGIDFLLFLKEKWPRFWLLICKSQKLSTTKPNAKNLNLFAPDLSESKRNC